VKNLIILIFLIFSYQGFSQILPSQHGVLHKKSSGGAVSDTWDSSTKASCITLSNSNLTSLESNCTPSWNNIYGSTGVSSGIKEWEITIDAWDNNIGNGYDVMIGVSKLRTQNPSTAVGNGSYCYILQNGQKFIMTSGYSASNYGASYGEGDVIKISLNMDTNQITFYKNGVSQGVAFTVSNGTYYLVAAYVKNTNAQITITG
tara:strand:- start:39 stop:647 length:609 start_codon:yes stop_codon:yes gene_type:complete